MILNLCKAFKPPADDSDFSSCSKISEPGYAFIANSNNMCYALSSSQNLPDITEILDDKKKPVGVDVTYTFNDKIGLNIKITCDKTMESGQIKNSHYLGKTGQHFEKIEFTSKDACPAIDLGSLFEFVSNYRYLWGGLFMIVGVFITFWGREMMKPTVFLLTLILVSTALMLLMYTMFFNNNHEDWVVWLTLGLSVLAGLVVAFFMVKFLKFGIAMTGGAAGASLGFGIMTAL